MNYLSVENITKSYGERILFEGLSFGINQGQKIAFIAKNGTGKSSLLRIITQKDEPDSGKVIYRSGISVAFLAQEPELPLELSIEEYIFFQPTPLLQAVRAYEQALLHPTDDATYQKAFEEMERLGGWELEQQYKQILTRLELSDLSLKIKSLSGGQKKRLALATILLTKPDLLLLDEPTNHLDLDMIEWLEAYFAKENITLFMVTHDRYFLERVCNEIIELDEGQLYHYKGNYAYFLEKKQQRIAQEQASMEKARNLYAKELQWMRRQPKARTTKSKSRIDDFYIIQEKAQKRRAEHVVELEINMERLGSKTIELHNVSKYFDSKVILDKFNYVFKRGERVGIIGKNGTGKSTFLNLITGALLPDAGKVVVGDTIRFGYYTQSGIAIVPGEKVIDVIKKFGEYIPLSKGRSLSAAQLLERFLFDRKKQYDYVEKLSGGELKRLYLCTILIQNPNFLILDEPTNDLDIITLNVLEEFLLDYPGCLVIVSHDRYFMDKITDHLFVFKGGGQVEDFPGNYTDYYSYEQSVFKEEPIVAEKEVQKNWRKDKPSQTQRQISKIEKEIAALEQEKAQMEAALSDAAASQADILRLSTAMGVLISRIDALTDEWLLLSES